MRKLIVGVMGPGAGATPENLTAAYDLGKAIAEAGWVLLTGGRAAGVMAAASQGAKVAGGLTVGILPGKNHQGLADSIDIAICTDLGNGRNNVNVLSADVVVAVGLGLGTVSEIALALKNRKPVILWQPTPATQAFFTELAPDQFSVVENIPEAIAHIKAILHNPT
ncbi:TIGR00725 family protein [Picosynechococcus sp. PCC 7003]|uniref:TIGR00725 family protein n=1 Tax=Picosynechococcus sp. PCC 7003 TaxID=374981 RepID=UPI000810ABAE|nr:TIGR00725 family protein [Picosynechococcus sp. PCC 7003]ANV84645.1 TIGR00725 family protein [Picosynechococcus sp. PCC 7003]